MIIKIGKFNFVSENKEEFRLFQDNSYSMFSYFYMDGKEDTLYVHSRSDFDKENKEYYKFEQELLKRYYILEYSSLIHNRIQKFISDKTFEIFKNNKDVMKYINENETAGRCHMNVEALSSIFPKYYTISSLLESYYEGYYYHSYTYNQCENLVIDASSRIVCSKDDYDRLMCPQEIMRIKNSKLSKYFKKIDRYSRNTYEVSNVFGVALMMQLKKMNRKDRKILAREINNS